MQPFKYISIIILLLLPAFLSAQYDRSPKCEYRAVWLTAIENLDWPKTIISSPADTLAQQRELCSILDSLQSLNVNTVMLQTRVRGDVAYPSAIEPYSYVFTGVEGRSPFYNPLAFAIEECHKRGMQLHAWIVAFPLGKDNHIKRMGKLSLPRKNRALCTNYKGSWYMEPGNPATADYLCRLVEEIVSCYDVDGIHLDYIRYPDRTVGYSDGKLHRRHGKGLSLAAWRRQNVTNVARKVYSTVKSIKPWVRVSCSPLGKYSDLACYKSYGWNARDAVYQEAQEWLREGIMDILFPMLYFKGDNFYPFVRDWQENSYGRHIVPGIGVYRLLPEYGGWSPDEFTRQLSTSRLAGTAGTALFRAEHLLESAGGAAEIYTMLYGRKALVPPMDWVKEPLPASPASLSLQSKGDTLLLSWQGVASAPSHPQVKYNVYASLSDSVDIENADNLLCINLSDTAFVWPCRTAKAVSVAVTAVDAYGRESEPVCYTLPAVYEPLQALELPAPRAAWQRLEIYDVYGRRMFAGSYSTRLVVDNLPQGRYKIKALDRKGRVQWSEYFKR
ncbi:MAG: family 10 glycosylhydrolase [Bacteroidaceae bacterium]|nr:family 10 glycosylhydrolase [Bacteroidaceae bacterium]